jgi:hypothetical protein
MGLRAVSNLFWQGVVLVLLGWGVWHLGRVFWWPQKGCRRCHGAGNFRSTTWWSGRPVRRMCPRCGGEPWEYRVGASNPSADD